MSGEKLVIDKDKTVDFSYPEGFMEAAASLDFLPEEVRTETLAGLAIGMLMM